MENLMISSWSANQLKVDVNNLYGLNLTNTEYKACVDYLVACSKSVALSELSDDALVFAAKLADSIVKNNQYKNGVGRAELGIAKKQLDAQMALRLERENEIKRKKRYITKDIITFKNSFGHNIDKCGKIYMFEEAYNVAYVITLTQDSLYAQPASKKDDALEYFDPARMTEEALTANLSKLLMPAIQSPNYHYKAKMKLATIQNAIGLLTKELELIKEAKQ